MTDQKIIDQAERIMASTPPANLIQALSGAGLLNPWSSVEEEQVRAEKAEAERDALAATVQRVRELAEGWHSRGEHDMEFSKQIPEGVRDAIYEAGAEMVERARLVRNALDDPQEQP